MKPSFYKRGASFLVAILTWAIHTVADTTSVRVMKPLVSVDASTAPKKVAQSSAVGYWTPSIDYNGGSILYNPIKVNLIFYGGGWSSSRKSIILDLIKSFSTKLTAGSVPSMQQWWNINRQYGDSKGRKVTPTVSLGNVVVDTGSIGSNLAANGGVTIIKKAIAAGKIKLVSGAVTFVLTGPSVKVKGFCTEYCAFHSVLKYGSYNVLYGLIGNSETQCPNGCSLFLGLTMRPPNGDLGVDSMVTGLAHELAEVATDPFLSAWYNSKSSSASKYSGYENADICNLEFSDYYFFTPKGANSYALYSHRGVNGRKYFVQDNFSLKLKKCVPYA